MSWKPEVRFVDEDESTRLRDQHPELVLVTPQIPQNTGSIARLCAAFQMKLHLIEPMGFKICEKRVRRAGLDYWPFVDVQVHPSWQSYREPRRSRRCIFVETGGTLTPTDLIFQSNDILVFGSETTGLPQDVIQSELSTGTGQLVTIPMFCRGVRSINLSNAVAIVMYQALAQLHGCN